MLRAMRNVEWSRTLTFLPYFASRHVNMACAKKYWTEQGSEVIMYEMKCTDKKLMVSQESNSEHDTGP